MPMIGVRGGCGCDCRDKEQYDEGTQGKSYSCCTVCEPGQRPCKWIARLPCGNITFAQCCQYTQGCVYVGADIDGVQGGEPPTGPPEAWCTWDYLYRLWWGTNSDPCGSLDWRWKLDLENRRVTYTAPFGAGSMVWKKADAWDCTGKNNLTRVSNTIPYLIGGMPKHLCVVPSEELQLPSCPDHNVAGEQVDSCYEDDAKRCACADECCECIGTVIGLRCGEDFESCIASACIGGPPGIESPDGPSRTACCTLLGREVCLTFYCSGGNWKYDVRIDGVFCQTVGIPHTACPFALGVSTFGPCDDCTGCVGEDCEPPPAVCCPCLTLEDKLLDVEVVCDGHTITTQSLNVSAIAGQCQFNLEDNDGDGCSVTGTIACDSEAGFSAAVSTNGSCSCIWDETAIVTVNSCSPIDVVFTNGDGDTITIVEVP